MNPFIKHKINGKVLHGRVQEFLHGFGYSMDLINKQDITAFKVSQKPDQIAPLIKGRPGSYGKLSPHLVCDDMGQGCFPQTRGAMKKHMINRLLALHGGFNSDFKGFHNFGLADIIRETFRTQG